MAKAKGDLLVSQANGRFLRRAVGADGQVLTADSTQPDGVKWAAGGGGAVGYQSTITAGQFILGGSAQDIYARLMVSGGYPSIRSWDSYAFAPLHVDSLRIGEYGSVLSAPPGVVKVNKPLDLPEGVPSGPPSSGVRLYVEGGVLKAMKPDGSSVTIG